MVNVLDIAGGKLAIYTSPGAGTDDAPLFSPLANLSRVKLHSDLDYPTILSVTTGTLSTASLPLIAANGSQLSTVTLFAHGRPGIPWVFGRFQIGGVWVSAAGTVIVQADTNQQFPRTVALGADATHVLAHIHGIAAQFSTMPAISLPWAVYVTDVLP